MHCLVVESFSKMFRSVLVAFVTVLIGVEFGTDAAIRFSSFEKPLFSNDPTDYDAPKSSDYYDDEEYPQLPNELGQYNKFGSGGLLPKNLQIEEPMPDKSKNSDESEIRQPTTKPKKSSDVLKEESPVATEKPANRKPEPAATWIRRSTDQPERSADDRIIIDGSDPNTDVFEELRKRLIVLRKPTPKPKLLDADGEEIAPHEGDKNRFHVLGWVSGCRMVKEETEVELDGTEVSVINEDPSVTGVTVEFILNIMNNPKQLYYRKTGRNGPSKFHLETIEDDFADMTLRWYSC